jgi:hypothetical protein
MKSYGFKISRKDLKKGLKWKKRTKFIGIHDTINVISELERKVKFSKNPEDWVF